MKDSFDVYIQYFNVRIVSVVADVAMLGDCLVDEGTSDLGFFARYGKDSNRLISELVIDAFPQLGAAFYSGDLPIETLLNLTVFPWPKIARKAMEVAPGCESRYQIFREKAFNYWTESLITILTPDDGLDGPGGKKRSKLALTILSEAFFQVEICR